VNHRSPERFCARRRETVRQPQIVTLEPGGTLRGSLESSGAEPMDEDPSNEAFVLSPLEGYGADEAEAMETEPAPTRRIGGPNTSLGWIEGNFPRIGPRLGASPGWPSPSLSWTTSCTSAPHPASCSGASPPLGSRAHSRHPCGRVWPPRGAAYPRGQRIPPRLLLANRSR
jgi:hypothetical protein